MGEHTTPEVARALGLPVSTVHHYTRLDLVPADRGSRGKGRDRLYSDTNLVQGASVCVLRSLGVELSLVELVFQILREGEWLDDPRGEWVDVLVSKIGPEIFKWKDEHTILFPGFWDDSSWGVERELLFTRQKGRTATNEPTLLETMEISTTRTDRGFVSTPLDPDAGIALTLQLGRIKRTAASILEAAKVKLNL